MTKDDALKLAPDWKDRLIEQQEETILWQAKRISELLDRQPKREWVGLTDADYQGMSAGDHVVAFWVDRILKEKNT